MTHERLNSEEVQNESNASDQNGPGLWSWACERYAKPGAADTLINCQDQFALNVNVLLWCCWCADKTRLLSDLEIRKALDVGHVWANEVTLPIRSARRALKLQRLRDDTNSREQFYNKVKGLELESEKLELELYEAIGGIPVSKQNSDCMIIARKNITAYVALSGAARRDGFSISLIDDIIQCIFGSVGS